MQLENRSQVLIGTLGRSKVAGGFVRSLIGQLVGQEERGVNRLGFSRNRSANRGTDSVEDGGPK
jgi:hypothetical protein